MLCTLECSNQNFINIRIAMPFLRSVGRSVGSCRRRRRSHRTLLWKLPSRGTMCWACIGSGEHVLSVGGVVKDMREYTPAHRTCSHFPGNRWCYRLRHVWSQQRLRGGEIFVSAYLSRVFCNIHAHAIHSDDFHRIWPMKMRKLTRRSCKIAHNASSCCAQKSAYYSLPTSYSFNFTWFSRFARKITFIA